MALVVNKLPANAGDTDAGSIPVSGRSPWRRAWQPTPVSLPGESHGQRSLAGYVHRVSKSQTWLTWLSTHRCMLQCEITKKYFFFKSLAQQYPHYYEAGGVSLFCWRGRKETQMLLLECHEAGPGQLTFHLPNCGAVALTSVPSAGVTARVTSARAEGLPCLHHTALLRALCWQGCDAFSGRSYPSTCFSGFRNLKLKDWLKILFISSFPSRHPISTPRLR